MSIKEIETPDIKTEDKTVKQVVQTMLDNLPDDVTWERLRYHLGAVESIWEGLQDVKAGRGIPHEELKERMKTWFK